MENHSYDQIIGSSDAPYINQLAGQHGIATNFFAESHPSLPNYIAMTSGSTQGIADDNPPSDHALDLPSIFSLLPAGGSRPTLVVAPSVAAGTQVAARLDHYALLRATQEMLGVTPLLGNAATAADMRTPFNL